MQLAVRALCSALLVVALSTLAARAPRLAGFVTALPLLTALTMGWLLVDGTPPPALASYLRGVLVGMGPTALLVAVVWARLRGGASLGPSALTGLAAWAFAVAVLFRAGALRG